MLKQLSQQWFEQGRRKANQWALQQLGHDWVDYIASNTMTDFNRWWNDFIWTYQLKAVVVAVEQQTPDVKTLTLMPNQRWQGMVAGQYVTVKTMIDGQTVERYYSLSPMMDGCFTITVKKIDGGVMSTWLHEQVNVGQVLDLEPAQGQFCYQKEQKALFIAAGTGITPCYSIIADLLASGQVADVQLYVQFSTPEQALFKQTLRYWQRRLPVYQAYSRDTQSICLTADNIEQLYPDFRERQIYLCGPSGFMERIIDVLLAKGFDLAQLHCERFVVAPSKSLTPVDDVAVEAKEIYFQHLNRHVQLTPEDQGRSLLEIGERHGVPLECGCRQGMCGSCKLTLKAGTVSGNQLGKAVYLCSAYPASTTVVLDA